MPDTLHTAMLQSRLPLYLILAISSASGRQALQPQPSLRYSIPLVICCLPTPMFVSYRWITAKLLIRSDSHVPLFDKLLMLNMPDEVCNWMRDYFQGHSHCTKFDSRVSAFLEIHASVFQGSAVGPASYVITAADLRTRHHVNKVAQVCR